MWQGQSPTIINTKGTPQEAPLVAIQKFECYLRAIISLLLHVAFITGSQRPVAPDPCGNILKSFFIEIVKVSLLCSHIGKYGAMCPQHLLTEAGGIRLFIEEHATMIALSANRMIILCVSGTQIPANAWMFWRPPKSMFRICTFPTPSWTMTPYGSSTRTWQKTTRNSQRCMETFTTSDQLQASENSFSISSALIDPRGAGLDNNAAVAPHKPAPPPHPSGWVSL